MKKFSIIVPVYYNEANLPDTIPQLLELGDRLTGYELELVFVDDGSGDRSLQILLDFQKKFPEIIKVLKLTRNFGAMAAVQAGLSQVRGDCVGIIAADLQDPPELFVEMAAEWKRGTRVVLAVRQEREDPGLQRFCSNAYYALLRRFALPGYPSGGFDFVLIDRQVVQDLLRIQEKNTNVMALIYWLGYRPVLIPYTRRARKKGKSRWTLAKKLKLFVDSFVSFSYFPIRLLSLVGLLVAGAAFLYGLIILASWMIWSVPVRGWVPTMILLTITAGVQMSMLGILGEYLWRTLDETRKRPPYVIDAVFEAGLSAAEKRSGE
ncbi:MAG: glycosyltransferase family 2 protein [Deltaproteobacteria bacterium]|nr:glycosyltransferase family 2 protein [Deltaproteobacteria bacterium]